MSKRSEEARVGVADPGIKIVVAFFADHGLKALDEAPGFGEQWCSSLDGRNGDRICFGEMIASHGQHPHNRPGGRSLAQLSLGHAFGSSPACHPFADDTGTAAEPISFETAPKLGAIAAAGIPLRVEQQEIGLGERPSKTTALSILRDLRAFFQWLCREPGYRSRLHSL